MGESNNHINYSAADIDRYHKGQLSAAEMHAMEKAALDDPFLADAMEGYEVGRVAINPESSEDRIAADINNLKKRLAERVAETKKAPVIKFSWWKVAAIVFLFLGVGWFYMVINSKAKLENIAKNLQVDKEAVPPLNTDGAVSVSPATDTSTARNGLAMTEKKQAVRNKNYSAADKFREPNRQAAPVAALDRAPADKNSEAEKDLLKSNAASGTIPAQSFYKADTIPLPSAKSPSTDDKALFADAIKKEKLVAAGMDEKASGIASNAYTTAADSLAKRTSNISNTFNGTVVDNSNKPLANATIQIPNLNIATVTDNKGYFSFKAPDSALSVSVASPGFETQNLSLYNNRSLNQITLKPDTKGLNEVVVVGYGTKRKKQASRKTKDVTINILDAEPSVDWNNYSAYLENNKKIPDEAKDIHGETVVSFTVDNKNMLKTFKIERSLTEQLDAEAIRLIKEGPSWRLLRGRRAKVSVVVKF